MGILWQTKPRPPQKTSCLNSSEVASSHVFVALCAQCTSAISCTTAALCTVAPDAACTDFGANML